MAVQIARARRPASIAAVTVLVVIALAGCGARAEQQPPDPQAERIGELLDQRDALVHRISVLEREARLRAMQPVAQSTPPSAHVRSTVVRRWVEPVTGDDHELLFELCVRSFDSDQVFGGQPVFFTSDLCGEVRWNRGEADPAITIASLLADEHFACWMLAAPERSLPDCFREFAREHTH